VDPAPALTPEPEGRLAWRLLPLMVYPLAQSTAFALACLLADHAPLAAAAWWALSALLLVSSVHIALHEWVHVRRSWAVIAVSAPFSLIVGLPFDGYRLHHLNHHQHDNGPGDFSCTWRAAPDGPRPRRLLPYCLGWPAQALRARRSIHDGLARGEAQATTRRLIEAQKVLLLLAIAALAWWSPRAALLYLAMTYAGWTLVSLQNYGQHPPRLGGGVPGASCTSRLYNLVFANNGLHWEHHRAPGRPWYRLRADPAAPRSPGPHLLNVR
jgi:fatty acid desaturase